MDLVSKFKVNNGNPSGGTTNSKKVVLSSQGVVCMKRLIVPIGLILFLGACAVASTLYLPNGSQGYSINCSGAALTWGACYQKASELCGSQGYQIVSADGQNGAMIGGNPSGFFGTTVMDRNMLISCGTAKHKQMEKSASPSAPHKF